MESALSSLETYGYIFIFFYSLGGGFVALAAAGVLASIDKINLAIAIPIAIIANFIGDMLLFYLARYNKSDVLKYVKKHRRKLALSHILMKRQGSKIIIFQKFIYGLKTLIPIAVGFTKFSLAKFVALNIFASIVWGLAVGLGSFFAGDSIIKAFSFAKENPIIMPLIAITIIALAWIYLEKATAKKIDKSINKK